MIQVKLLHSDPPAGPAAVWLPAVPPVGSGLWVDGVGFTVLAVEFSVDTSDDVSTAEVVASVERRVRMEVPQPGGGNDLVLRVYCPTCQSGLGEPCREDGGYLFGGACHTDRLRLALAAGGQP